MKGEILAERTIDYGSGKFFEIKVSKMGNSKILFFSKGMYSGSESEKRYFKGLGIPYDLIDEILKNLKEVMENEQHKN